jgi:hypothetical protein
MARYLSALLCLFTSLLSAGCLVKDTTHRLYLSPDGGVVWSVLERDVRSDEGAPWDRWREEAAFLEQVSSTTHPVLEGLRRLGPEKASLALLRAERPYAVTIDARFRRVDELLVRLFEELQVQGAATVHRQGDLSTLVISIDVSDGTDDETDTPAVALLEDLDRYRIVLTEGRFVSASGFDIGRDGTIATFASESAGADGPIELRLVWKNAR